MVFETPVLSTATCSKTRVHSLMGVCAAEVDERDCGDRGVLVNKTAPRMRTARALS